MDAHRPILTHRRIRRHRTPERTETAMADSISWGALILVVAAVFVIGLTGYHDTFRELKEVGVVSPPL